MNPVRARPIVLLGAMLFGAVASAQTEPPARDRRAEIAAERAAVTRRYADQEDACRKRFVVTACLNDARDQRRAALAPLRQEELRIDTEERKERAAVRLGEIDSKQRAEAVRDAASAPQAPRAATGPPATQRPSNPIGGGVPKPQITAEERVRREAESEAKFERRQDDAEHHRAAVQARNAERVAKGKAAKPLEGPSAASAP